MAQQIRDTREHSLDQRDEELLGGRDNSTSAGAMSLALFTPISTGAPEDRGVIAEDTVLSPEELAAAESTKQLSERTRNLGTEQVAILLRNAALQGIVVIPQNTPPTAQVSAHRPTQADRKADLRAANNQMAARISKAHGIDHKTVNGRLNAAVGIPKLRQATEDQLEDRLRFAHRWLAGEAQPAAGS